MHTSFADKVRDAADRGEVLSRGERERVLPVFDGIGPSSADADNFSPPFRACAFLLLRDELANEGFLLAASMLVQFGSSANFSH